MLVFRSGAGVDIVSVCAHVCTCPWAAVRARPASIAMKGCVREKGVSFFQEELGEQGSQNNETE